MNCTNSCLERNAIGPGPRETIESRYLCDRAVFSAAGVYVYAQVLRWQVQCRAHLKRADYSLIMKQGQSGT
jgi:hypothetical protein